MSDRCEKCGEGPNPDGQCACPSRMSESSFAAPTLLDALRGKMKEKDDEADRLYPVGDHQKAYGARCFARGIETAINEIQSASNA